jgi:hypothetical protein
LLPVLQALSLSFTSLFFRDASPVTTEDRRTSMPSFPDPDKQLLDRLDQMDESIAEVIVDLRRSLQLLTDTVGRLHQRIEKLENNSSEEN